MLFWTLYKIQAMIKTHDQSDDFILCVKKLRSSISTLSKHLTNLSQSAVRNDELTNQLKVSYIQ